MSTLIVTVRSTSPRGTLDLELPGEVPLQNLLPAMVRVLQLPPTDGAGQPIAYQLVHQTRGRPLGATEALLSARVVTGDIVSLVPAAAIGAMPKGVSRDHRSASALLRCPSGIVIALDNYGKPELTVGRYDARTDDAPDIDLSGEPAGNTVSRSQALLRKQGDQWTVVHLSARNSTWVGNTQLVPQQSWPLKPGDVITFGGVGLVFQRGSPP